MDGLEPTGRVSSPVRRSRRCIFQRQEPRYQAGDARGDTRALEKLEAATLDHRPEDHPALGMEIVRVPGGARRGEKRSPAPEGNEPGRKGTRGQVTPGGKHH